MDLATSHLCADADAIASLVAIHRLDPGLELWLPGGMDRVASRAWKALSEDLPPLLGDRELERRLAEAEQLGRLVVVDTSRPERLGLLREHLGRFREVVALDTHPPADGDLERGELPDASACVAGLAIRLASEGIVPTPAEATLFLVGLHVETGGFCYASTQPGDHRAAALCLAWGADAEAVGRLLPHSYTRDQLRLLERMGSRATLVQTASTPVAVTTLELPAWEPDLSRLLGELRQAEGWGAAFLVAAAGGSVQVIGRSDGQLDVGRVLGGFRGGGHAAAASATVPDATLAEVRDQLGDAIRELDAESRVDQVAVRDFVEVAGTATVDEAAKLLWEHRINALPVRQEDAYVATVTRHELDAALRAGLGDADVLSVASREPVWVEPGTPLSRVRDLFLRDVGRVALVGTPPDDAIGLVTRTTVWRQAAREAAGRSTHRPHRRQVLQLARASLGAAYELIEGLGQLAEDGGGALWVAGPAVRQVLLDRPVEGLELLVLGDAEAVVSAMEDRRDGLPPMRLTPVASLTALNQELFRQDFTVDALAFLASGARAGELVDPYGGYDDLRNGTVRVLHGLAFQDDPTLTLRAAALCAGLELSLAPATRALLRAVARGDPFQDVDPQRIGRELDRILGAAEPAQGLRVLDRLGLLQRIHPRLRADGRTLARVQGVLKALHTLGGRTARDELPRQAEVLRLVLGWDLDRDIRDELSRLVSGDEDAVTRWRAGPARVRRATYRLGRVTTEEEARRRLQRLDAAERTVALGVTRDPAALRWLWWWEEERRRAPDDASGSLPR